MTFSLHRKMREVFDASPGIDYPELAGATIASLTEEEKHAALDAAMVQFARHFMTGLRRTPPGSRHGYADSHQPSQRVRDRAQARRLWLESTMRGRYQRKPFGDFTADDLEAYLQRLEVQAVRNLDRADWGRHLIKQLDAHHVTRVRDLPADVLDEYGR